jgi:hypothetical protein
MEQEKDNSLYWIIGGGLLMVIVLVLITRKSSMTDPSKRIPGVTANSAQWIAWHKAMLKFGYAKDDANALFLEAFSKSGSYDANDYNLREYVQTQGFEITGGLGSSAYDGAIDTYSAFDNILPNISGFVLVGVIIVIAIFGFVGYQLFKNDE